MVVVIPPPTAPFLREEGPAPPEAEEGEGVLEAVGRRGVPERPRRVVVRGPSVPGSDDARPRCRLRGGRSP